MNFSGSGCVACRKSPARTPEPLFHSLEADLPYTTGGDLGLVPPVLRRYWGHFLGEGPFETWERAVGWFQSLSHEERAVAGKYLGFEHLDLRQYPDLAHYPPPTGLLATSARVLEVEERQRLTDFAEQFDLLLGDAQSEEDFRFWRGYLQDKVALYRSHPGHLESLDLPWASDLADALKFLSGLSGTPESRASMLADRIYVQPFLVNFLPAVDNQILVRLFAAGPQFPPAATLQATASFVERLQRFGAVVDDIAVAGGESPEDGARALEEFLADTGLEQEHDLKLFFDLFRDNDPPLARRIMSAVDPATVRGVDGACSGAVAFDIRTGGSAGEAGLDHRRLRGRLDTGYYAAHRGALRKLPDRRALLGAPLRGDGPTGAGRRRRRPS